MVAFQYKVSSSYLVLLLAIAASMKLASQSQLTGIVVDSKGNTVVFANVLLDDAKKFAISDENGKFEINNLQSKKYILTVSSLGYQTIKQNIDLSKTSFLELRIVLLEDVEGLDEVEIVGKSQATIINEQPLAVSSLNLKTLQNTSSDPAALLDRINGIRVRQTGGVGSEVNISIQGAQGNAVRRYFDGLPIRFLSAGLDITNLPVNQVERIDVYRGVTPLEVGTDALGGGINIIPKKYYDDYVDVNYQIGSFNTHRTSINVFQIADNETFFGSNVFVNYTDNNYKIDAQAVEEDPNSRTIRATRVIEAERFNDTYRAYFGEFFAGIRNKKWADELKLSIAYSDIFDEVQTGVVFNPVRPAGDLFNESSGVTSTVDYSVGIIEDQLKLKTKTNFGVYRERILDSTANFYDWEGNILQTPNNRGTDLLAAPADIEINRDIFLQRSTLIYDLDSSHKITVSNLFINQRREGRNAFVPKEEDAFQFPAKLNQNFAGVEWLGSWFNSNLESVLTYKNYHLFADATSLETIGGQDFENRTVNNNYSGANIALKYSFNPKLFVRTSYEYAYRLPEENELFGNQSTIRSNINLRPEQSDNYNLGAFYRTKIFNDMQLAVEVNGFYRYQQDRIILLASGFDLAQFFNEEEVEIAGVDGYISIEPNDNSRLNLSATYQDVRIRSALDEVDSGLIGERQPNVPYFFMSFDGSYNFKNIINDDDILNVSYFYDFIEEFSSVREANANQNIANFIPTQHRNAVEITYTDTSGKWNFSGKVNNIFNDDLYDNFRVQLPGTNVNFKIRYNIQ
ncbi:MAG: TonB-dependent receptor [Bacteroidota bacterium]